METLKIKARHDMHRYTGVAKWYWDDPSNTVYTIAESKDKPDAFVVLDDDGNPTRKYIAKDEAIIL